MHYQHKRNLIDIVDDLYKFSKDFDLDSFELLSIVIAMSNSLSKVHHPDYVISDFYYPYEIIFTGVHKEIDRQSFFAGVMSMLCYDVSVIFRDNQMIMGVLVENKQDYYYQEKKYQALLPHFDPEVEKVFTFDEICHFDKVYQDPVSSNIRHQLREAQYIGDVQYKFSNVQSDGRSYKSNVSITNEFVSESKRLKDNKVRIDQNSQIKGYVIKDDGQRLEVVSEIR
ncbi:MAG: hypothetical protein IT215_07460 [Chitinophagaceae bacterium]|nr:hypothetical protein [Chitinophagaceae bacterium]